MSPGTLCRDRVGRWVDRVWALRLRDGGWRVGVLDGHGRKYLDMDGCCASWPVGDVVSRKDITLSWYAESD